MKAALEVIGLMGSSEKAHEKINVLKGLICEPQLRDLQLNLFACIVKLGYVGFAALVEIASKDYSNLQTFLLNNLLQLRPVQRIILVPSILA